LFLQLIFFFFFRTEWRARTSERPPRAATSLTSLLSGTVALTSTGVFLASFALTWTVCQLVRSKTRLSAPIHVTKLNTSSCILHITVHAHCTYVLWDINHLFHRKFCWLQTPGYFVKVCIHSYDVILKY
jgi:hypothetical protein